MTTRGSRIDWLVFLALGFLWGSSYLFIKIGVDHGLQPFTLIMFRLGIGFVLLASVVAYFREPLPRDPRMYGHLFVMGVINIAIPFTLITFAEQAVSSSLALGETYTIAFGVDVVQKATAIATTAFDDNLVFPSGVEEALGWALGTVMRAHMRTAQDLAASGL